MKGCFVLGTKLFVVISVEEKTYEETETQAPQDEAKIKVGGARPCKKFAE